MIGWCGQKWLTLMAWMQVLSWVWVISRRPVRKALERAQGGGWLPQELLARRNNLRCTASGLNQQLEGLTEAYLAGVVGLEEYKRGRQEVEQRQQALTAQARELEMQANQNLN